MCSGGREERRELYGTNVARTLVQEIQTTHHIQNDERVVGQRVGVTNLSWQDNGNCEQVGMPCIFCSSDITTSIVATTKKERVDLPQCAMAYEDRTKQETTANTRVGRFGENGLSGTTVLSSRDRILARVGGVTIGL